MEPEMSLYTVRYVVGEIAKAPALPPGQIWRRKIAPVADACKFFSVQSDAPNFEQEYREWRPEWSDAQFETKRVLEDGDEFSARTTAGLPIKLTVGAPIPPGGNP